MRAKSLRMVFVAVLVMMALVLAAVPTFAQSGSSNSMVGMNNWQTLQPGQSVEYRLNFLGSGSGKATVMVGSNPSGAINYNVYTDQAWKTSGDPIGKGTVQKTVFGNPGATASSLYSGDLIWQTNDPSGGVYHIQITNTSQQAAQYWIDATGAGNGGLSAFNAPATTLAMTSGANTGAATAAGTTASASSTTTNQGPLTLPVTGGSANVVLYLGLGAGLALIAAGWLTTRKAAQR